MNKRAPFFIAGALAISAGLAIAQIRTMQTSAHCWTP